MGLRDVERVRRGHRKHVLVEEFAAKRGLGLRDSRLERMPVPDAGGAAVLLETSGVQLEHVLDDQEDDGLVGHARILGAQPPPPGDDRRPVALGYFASLARVLSNSTSAHVSDARTRALCASVRSSGRTSPLSAVGGTSSCRRRGGVEAMGER